MATVTDYEDLRWALISAFHTAIGFRRIANSLDESRSGYAGAYEDKAIDYHVGAFKLAAIHGWDCSEDAEWAEWSHGATKQEILAEGLRLALERCRPDPCPACKGAGGKFVEPQEGFPIWQDCDECS